MLAGGLSLRDYTVVDLQLEGNAMTVRRFLWCLALASAGSGIACGDFTGPNSPEHKSLSSPVRASNTRYILISGVWTCVDGCDEVGGPEQREQGELQTPPEATETPVQAADSTTGEAADSTEN